MVEAENNICGQAISGRHFWRFAVGACMCVIFFTWHFSIAMLPRSPRTIMQRSISRSRFTVPSLHNSSKVDQDLAAAPIDDRVMDNGRKPSIVILVGPRKTGTSTTQHCMADWTVHGHREHLPNWSWPVPSRGDLINLNVNPRKKEKRFALLVKTGLSIHGQKETQPTILYRPEVEINASAVVELFRGSIQKSWSAGFKVVIGTEAFDNVLGQFADPMKDLLLSVLPSSTDLSGRPFDPQEDNIEVVVNFRTPLIDHLRSFWRQQTKGKTPRSGGVAKKNKVESFKDFLLRGEINPILSLDIALMYLERGFNTTIVNQIGIKEEDRDLCHVIACDIMKENCTKSGYLFSVPQNETRSEVKNAGVDAAVGLNITDEQMSRINDVAFLYDCGLRKELEKYEKTKQLKVLFQQHYFLDNCPDKPTKHSKEWLQEKIRIIATEDHH
mmetsp:Transcript_13393/g.32704  ORF Transcript_13393/g.32704 Transcript_13393/m.32704 type:complete len:442 (+) Transcript_13393:145-1470(+)